MKIMSFYQFIVGKLLCKARFLFASARVIGTHQYKYTAKQLLVLY